LSGKLKGEQTGKGEEGDIRHGHYYENHLRQQKKSSDNVTRKIWYD